MVLIYRYTTGGPVTAEALTVDVPTTERRLLRTKQLALSLPSRQAVLQQTRQDLGKREKALLKGDTAAQAQGVLLQTVRKVCRSQQPPLDITASELGQVRPLGKEYGEVLVTVGLNCRVEQLLNVMAELTQQPDLIATDDVRVSSNSDKTKMLNVRLTVAGVVDRKLVPEKRGPTF